MADSSQDEHIEHEICPMCRQKSLALNEHETEVPYFGKVFLFSMTCASCKYHVADVEAIEQKEPSVYTFEISSTEDLKVRVVKSSNATVKIPHITTITPGPAAQGYVSNIEGIINRVKHAIEIARDSEEDNGQKQKAKNMLKKLFRVICGEEKLKIIIEDPTGNSAIISEKAEKKPFKVKNFSSF